MDDGLTRSTRDVVKFIRVLPKDQQKAAVDKVIIELHALLAVETDQNICSVCNHPWRCHSRSSLLGCIANTSPGTVCGCRNKVPK